MSEEHKRYLAELIGTAFMNTVILAAAAATIGLAIGISLGMLAALLRGRLPDNVLSFMAMLALTLSAFSLLMIIGLWLPTAFIRPCQ